MRSSRFITRVLSEPTGSLSVVLPREALDALGVDIGAGLEIEIVGRALVIRSVEEATRSREFTSAFESILTRRRAAYEDLAK